MLPWPAAVTVTSGTETCTVPSASEPAATGPWLPSAFGTAAGGPRTAMVLCTPSAES